MGVLLISETKLKNFTNINQNVDMNLLKSSVEIAQDIELQPILGTKFYEHLLSCVNSTGNTFNNDEKVLVDEYISKYLIQAAYYHAMSSIQFRVMNRSIVEGTMENATPVDVETFKYLKNTQKQRVDFYLMRLQDYLIVGNGQNKFPLYLTQSRQDGMVSNKKAGYMSSIYLPQVSREGYSLNELSKMGNIPVYWERGMNFGDCPECL